MKTVVIIPNYNGKKFLDPCMSALRGQTYRDFRVLIVDNGSADGSRELLSSYEEDGSADVVCLPENTGFSGAVNAGIEAALRMDPVPSYVVLLNNDTEAEPGYLEAMARLLDSDTEKKIGAVSPLMVNMHDPSRIDSAGDGYAVCGWAFQRGTGRKTDLPKFSKRKEVFSACAGAAMYRMEALLDIRYPDGDFFDLLHFAYLEDVDVSFRMRELGYRILYEPGSRVLHYGSGTSGSKYNEFKVRLAARNNVYLNWKNMPFFQLLLNLPAILCGLFVKWVFFTARGFGGVYWKGFLEGIRTLPKVRCHKVRFRAGRLPAYISLEFRMIADTFSYLGDLIGRKILKN